MSAEIEIWLPCPPAVTDVEAALARFGEVVAMRDGSFRLVEGEEDPREGVPIAILDGESAPEAVRAIDPAAAAAVRVAVLMSGARGFWLARVGVALQRALGGVVFVPASGQAFADAHAYEASWPGEHKHG